MRGGGISKERLPVVLTDFVREWAGITGLRGASGSEAQTDRDATEELIEDVYIGGWVPGKYAPLVKGGLSDPAVEGLRSFPCALGPCGRREIGIGGAGTTGSTTWGVVPSTAPSFLVVRIRRLRCFESILFDVKASVGEKVMVADLCMV